MPAVAVIGAGAAGLSAAKHLVAAGCAVTIFELGSRIGGLWVYENDNGLSFTTPTKRTHPVGHHLLMAQFIWGRVRAKPGIDSVSGREVRVVDGTTGRYDTIIAATGYDVDLPFLASDLSPIRGHWLDLYRRVVPPGVTGLYFVGFFNVTGGGNIRMMDDQAEWVADLVTGRAALPDEAAMRTDINRERARTQALYPDSPRYGLELEPAEYRASLAQERRRAASSQR